MRLQKFILSLLSIVLFANVGRSQVITTIPQFATENDSIVVIFDATAGDGGLAGYTGDIYAHTGVLTDQSGSTGWRYVIADWGVNLPKAKLTNLGPDRWQLTIGKVHEYYGVPQNEKIYQLAFVFRNSDGSRTGRDANGADIFLPLFESGLSLVFIEPEISIPFGDPARTPLFINNKDTLK
ncbi:alpha-amylase, partial [candidate division KSB1 bacterium]|nr:alpha-amylase [candidate division KSB1 bacterium]